MIVGLSARDRRTLTVGALAVGSLFALGRGLPGLLQWQETQLRRATIVMGELDSARVASRDVPLLRDSLVATRMRLMALDSTILSGPTPSAAAATLAAVLGDMASDAAVKVSAMQLNADSVASNSLAQVGVRMTAIADVYGLMALLRAIEGGDTLLVVREIAVNQPEPAAPANKQESLRVEVSVAALVRIGQEVRR